MAAERPNHSFETGQPIIRMVYPTNSLVFSSAEPVPKTSNAFLQIPACRQAGLAALLHLIDQKGAEHHNICSR